MGFFSKLFFKAYDGLYPNPSRKHYLILLSVAIAGLIILPIASYLLNGANKTSANIGDYSVVMGQTQDKLEVGESAVVIGAMDDYGRVNLSSGAAIGHGAKAYDSTSIAIGHDAEAGINTTSE